LQAKGNLFRCSCLAWADSKKAPKHFYLKKFRRVPALVETVCVNYGISKKLVAINNASNSFEYFNQRQVFCSNFCHFAYCGCM